jgi:HAMP domain-containing protein
VRAGLAGENFTSPFRVDAVSDTPGLNLSVPVRKGSAVVGVVAVRVRGAAITAMLSDALSAQGQDVTQREQAAVRAFLVNDQGIVVGESSNTGWLGRTLLDVNSPDLLSRIAVTRPLGVACPGGEASCDPGKKIPRMPEQVMAAQPLGDTLVKALQAGESGSYRYCRPEGSADVQTGSSGNDCPGGWHVVGYAPVRTPSQPQMPRSQSINLLMAVVDVPEGVFLESVSRQRALGLAIAAIIALVAVVAALLLAGALSRPIKRLAAVSQEVEADKPFEPAGIADLAGSGDEVGHLARVYVRMVQSLRARMAELATIYDIGHNISSSIELPETLDFIASSIRQVIAYDALEICLYERGQDRIVLHLAIGGESIASDPPSYPSVGGLIGRIWRTKEGSLVSDLRSEPDAQADTQRTWRRIEPRSYLGVPLLLQGEVIGTIEMVHREPGFFSPDNLRVLESIAVQAAVAIDNAQQVDARESALRLQIEELRIEIDEARREKDVQSIVGTEYFQQLREKARRLRVPDRDSTRAMQP